MLKTHGSSSHMCIKFMNIFLDRRRGERTPMQLRRTNRDIREHMSASIVWYGFLVSVRLNQSQLLTVLLLLSLVVVKTSQTENLDHQLQLQFTVMLLFYKPVIVYWLTRLLSKSLQVSGIGFLKSCSGLDVWSCSTQYRNGCDPNFTALGESTKVLSTSKSSSIH